MDGDNVGRCPLAGSIFFVPLTDDRFQSINPGRAVRENSLRQLVEVRRDLAGLYVFLRKSSQMLIELQLRGTKITPVDVSPYKVGSKAAKLFLPESKQTVGGWTIRTLAETGLVVVEHTGYL